MKTYSILFILGVVFISSCTKTDYSDKTTLPADQKGVWLVPFEDILYYGKPHDRIQSIDDPHFEKVSESNWNSDDRMLVQQYKDVVRVYPVNILEEHEIVNDQVDGQYFAITYCPITGSGMSWNRNIGNEVTEFGVSGMLYRENLIPYDRETGSYWSQMKMVGIHGEHIEFIPEPGMLFETDFGFLKTYFPEAEILTDNDLDFCNDSTCVGHKSSTLITAVGSGDGEITPGVFYYGIVNREQALLFELGMFNGEGQLYSFGFRGKKMIVVGSASKNFMVSFETTGNIGKGMTFESDRFPVVMQDDAGNEYNVFGRVTAGPDEGLQLEPGMGYRAKGFAWESLFNSVEIYQVN